MGKKIRPAGALIVHYMCSWPRILFLFDVLPLIAYLAQTEHPMNVHCGLYDLQAALFFLTSLINTNRKQELSPASPLLQ